MPPSPVGRSPAQPAALVLRPRDSERLSSAAHGASPSPNPPPVINIFAPVFQFSQGDNIPQRDIGQQEFSFQSLHNSIPPRWPPNPPQAPSIPRLQISSPADKSDGTSSNHHPPSRRISEVSSLADEETDPIPYDVRDEVAPSHPFFTHPFQAALQNGVNIAKDTTTFIDKLIGYTANDKDLESLLQDARELTTFRGSDTRTIAVLGDSGEGKSSLINSLVHFPGIAKTGDIGSACTSVVTEYRQKLQEHTAPITIEVEYLSGSEIENLVKELLWSYRQLYLPIAESDALSAKEYNRLTKESDQAWSALEAAFGHYREFKKELLQDMSEGALERITDQVIRWAQDIEWPDGETAGFWKSTADTAEECCEKTSIFMHDKLWPFTKIIRVYLDAQVLATGIVLADLPSLQDTNLARVRATEEYLLSCSNIFIVAKISRAITDQSLKSSLYSVLSRHIPLEWEESGGKRLNVAIICTKSEDIDLQAARREFCSPSGRVSPSVVEQLDADIACAKAAGNRRLKKELKIKRDLLFINARNEHVKEGLQKAYSSKVPGGKLDVFCVSNTTYQKYSRKGNFDMVQSSGIPEVRRFCHGITAEAQFREAKHFLQSRLHTLLNSLDLWATASLSRDRPETNKLDKSIYDCLESIATEIRQAVTTFIKEFRKCVQDQIFKFLETRDDAWQQAAVKEGEAWLDWHWTQYSAWCLNNGNHATPKRGPVNWNAKIIWKMRSELGTSWELVEDEVSDGFESLWASIKGPLEELKQRMIDSSSHESFKSLIDGVDSQIDNAEYKLGRLKNDFALQLGIIRRNASESNYNSYVLSEMIPSYRDASSQYGTGKSARQKAAVHGHISDGTVFPNISVVISNKMNGLIREMDRSLTKMVKRVLDRIQKDLDMAFATPDRTRGNAEVDDTERLRLDQMFLDDVKDLKKRQVEVVASIRALPLSGT